MMIPVAFTAAAAAMVLVLAGLPLAAGSGLEAWHVFVAFTMAATVGLLSASSAARDRAFPARTPNSMSVLAGAVYAWFCFRTFFWWAVERHDGIYVFSPHNTGDCPLHLAFTNYLASGVRFWPQMPILSGTALGYPIGTDLLSAALVRLGLDGLMAILWINVLLCIPLALATRRWGGWFALAGLMFNGGLAGFELFKTGVLRDFQAELAWKSIPLAMLTTQRGFLLAIPMGLVLMTAWRTAGMTRRRILPLPVTTLLFGALPLVHTHTWVFLTGLLLFWIGFGARRFRRLAAVQLATGLPLSAGTLALATGFFQRRAGPAWDPGWMQDGPWFWLVNFGVFLPLLAVVSGIAAGSAARALAERRPIPHMSGWHFAAPSALCFIACVFIRFAPWEWDNTKLMLWCYLGCLPDIARWLRQKLPMAPRAAAWVLLFFSGAVSLAGGLTVAGQGTRVISQPEYASVKHALARIPSSARFACAPHYAHPVLLSGRPIAMGYVGHLWSYGLDYRSQEADLERLMTGRRFWREHARRLDVTYIFWGEREGAKWGADLQQPWRTPDRLVASGPWGTIYSVDRLVEIDLGKSEGAGE